MKVIYDISVLAQAHRHANARTGVFRVVDSVARGLATANQCDLSFCVSEPTSGTLDFLGAGSEFKDIRLHLAPPIQFALWLNKVRSATMPRANGSYTVGRRLLARSLYELARLTPRFGGALPTEELRLADVYHSTFYPLPEQIKAADNVKRFLTVYDLIPILQPHLFLSDMKGLLSKIIGSLGRADFALVISECTKNDLCNYRTDLDPERIFITQPAASTLFYPCLDKGRQAAVRRKYNLPENGSYFLSLSTLEPRKNVEQVIKSFARLVREQRLQDVYLILAGAEGWDYQRIFETLARFDVSDKHIILPGYIDDEDLAPLYSQALGFVYMTLYEGFGLPPLEAMQCGVPVITSNTSSLPEVVGEAGIMVDPTDEDAICQSMFRVYNDVELRAQLSKNSVVRASRFSWNRCVSETITAYESALGLEGHQA